MRPIAPRSEQPPSSPLISTTAASCPGPPQLQSPCHLTPLGLVVPPPSAPAHTDVALLGLILAIG